ncbi:HNH endonuclease [Candidatus Nitrosotenuis aquarius]|uniref:HNH endonuclease n=1 Tax=Candidatus Nitrosotenuis aquarius TaxID=1846278 RepID=UPI000C1DEF86|nr:HNH endonuclease [Candidatus Nitrosotenuis aquarius]
MFQPIYQIQRGDQVMLQTATQKLRKRNYYIQRDGPTCIYCEKTMDFEHDTIEFDHLDNNPHNNAEWNEILCHGQCNKEKRFNPEYQIKAREKILENQRRIFVPKVEDKTDSDVSPEIDHNRNSRNLIKQKLLEVVITDGRIEYKTALNGLTFLVSENLGHGSQVSTRRLLDELTSDFPGFEGPFMVERGEDGKKYIIKRSGK